MAHVLTDDEAKQWHDSLKTLPRLALIDLLDEFEFMGNCLDKTKEQLEEEIRFERQRGGQREVEMIHIGDVLRSVVLSLG